MNKKIFGILVAVLAVTLMLTPLAVAKPGAPKNNEKFEYFKLVCSGEASEIYDRGWLSPPEALLIPNTWHGRGGGWVTGDTVELTVGDETFNMTTDPYSVNWTTTFDIELFIDNDGNAKGYNLRLTDVLTVYDEGVEIGTLVLKIKSVIDLTVMPPEMGGNIVGYGTGELKDVHISAVGLGMTDPVNLLYAREGTITGWPDYITNP